MVILSRDARRLDPEPDLDTLLRPFTGDQLKLLDAAIAAFCLACQRPTSDLAFPTGEPLEFANVHLINAEPMASGSDHPGRGSPSLPQPDVAA